MSRAAHSSTELEDHDRGLAFDLATLMDRRQAMQLFAGTALFVVAGCGSGSDDATPTAAGTTTGANATAAESEAACEDIPEETAGPYPGDGSNGPNVLTETGVVRSDIRSSFGSASGVAEGVPCVIRLTIQDASGGCAALAGGAVYLWHCNRDGEYSLYGAGVENENYLRGVQEVGSNGVVTFTSVFPACYSGRWPHTHFEVYPSLDDATSAANTIATSQVALPEDVCDLVYATDGYEQSVVNLSQTSLQSDNVFGDGWDQQLATWSGSVADGITVDLAVPV